MEAIQQRHLAIRLRAEILWALAALPLIAVLMWLLLHNQLNKLFAAVFTISLLLIAARSKAAAALCTLTFLILLGDIRRVISWISEPATNDFLLLVGPLVAAVLAIPLLLRVRLRDRLSKAMLLLLLIMVLEIANPVQGGLSVGLAGAIFYIAPVCWFWVGRRYGSPEIIAALVYRIIFPMAVVAAILGLIQTFVGFLPWEQAWIDQVKTTYTALYLGGTIRAFGFANSGAEHTALMAMALVAICAAAFAGRRGWLVALPLLILGVLLSSSRGYVIKIVLAIACAWAFRKGAVFSAIKLLRLGGLTVAGLVAVSLVAAQIAPDQVPSGRNQSAAGNAISHEASGLAHPFDSRYSTAGVHGAMVVTAIADTIARPLGAGLGATTAAAAKYGGSPEGHSPTIGSSEVDMTDMLLSLGIVGGLTYIYIVFASFASAIRYVKREPMWISLPLLSILVGLVLSWLIGGQYGISSIIFFMLGGLAWSRDSEGQAGGV